MHNILTVARKEFRDGFRNRWIIAITGIFAALALAIAYFGAVTAGRVGFTSFGATIASLTTLGSFVIPLISLLIAYDTIVGEADGGTLQLLLAYPLSRAELATGKFLGHSTVLATAIIAGFGVAVAAYQIMMPEVRTLAAWAAIGTFMLSASMLGASFVGFACLISVFAREKARAAGLALLTWFLLVVLFDLVLLAVLVISGGNEIERSIFPYLLMLNPIDVFRLINLIGLGAGAGNAVFLAMTAGHAYNVGVLFAALVVWLVAPFVLALLAFRTQEI